MYGNQKHKISHTLCCSDQTIYYKLYINSASTQASVNFNQTCDITNIYGI